MSDNSETMRDINDAILVMSEYCSTCLWKRRGGKTVGEIEFEELSLPQDLRDKIRNWNTLYSQDDEKCGAGTPSYEATGLEIARQIKDLVGDKTNVIYVGADASQYVHSYLVQSDGTFRELSKQ